MELNCRDFERLINEQLDAREAAAPEVEQALAGHGAACPACRSTALRYQALSQAIAALTLHPPLPPADFAARFAADWASRALAVEDAEEHPILTFRPAFGLIAAAAVLLLAVWVGVRSGWRLPPGRPAAPPPHGPADRSRCALECPGRGDLGDLGSRPSDLGAGGPRRSGGPRRGGSDRDRPRPSRCRTRSDRPRRSSRTSASASTRGSPHSREPPATHSVFSSGPAVVSGQGSGLSAGRESGPSGVAYSVALYRNPQPA